MRRNRAVQSVFAMLVLCLSAVGVAALIRVHDTRADVSESPHRSVVTPYRGYKSARGSHVRPYAADLAPGRSIGDDPVFKNVGDKPATVYRAEDGKRFYIIGMVRVSEAGGRVSVVRDGVYVRGGKR